MKYFTPELIEHLGSPDDATAQAAHADWEDAVTRHETQLRAIRPELPAALADLWDNYYLHDAEVLSVGRQGQTFIIVLRLNVPPHELLILHYQLLEEPLIDTTALPSTHCSSPVAWMYDEVDLVRGENSYCTHSILFSNGWEVQLRFRDMQLLTAQTLLPVASTSAFPPVPQSA
jgi:hypothetical protein